jgi:hypothetical protein
MIIIIIKLTYGNAKFTLLLPLDQIDNIMTDSGIPEEEAEAYRSMGISIIVAEPLTESYLNQTWKICFYELTSFETWEDPEWENMILPDMK